MRRITQSVFASLAVAVLLAGGLARAAELSPAPQDQPDSQTAPDKPDAQAPQAK
ncbi:MAG: hypothetical protein JOY52_04815, partial [Hyphomicrobiales bacterium]|nr:hypothetical protein [Hyphomicrobiales bacterium]